MIFREGSRVVDVNEPRCRSAHRICGSASQVVFPGSSHHTGSHAVSSSSPTPTTRGRPPPGCCESLCAAPATLREPVTARMLSMARKKTPSVFLRFSSHKFGYYIQYNQ